MRNQTLLSKLLPSLRRETDASLAIRGERCAIVDGGECPDQDLRVIGKILVTPLKYGQFCISLIAWDGSVLEETVGDMSRGLDWRMRRINSDGSGEPSE